jgi:hypothetical protein
MGDSANMRSPTKRSDEKHSFEDSVVSPTRITSAANATRFLLEKLSAWGVEERGAYRISGPSRENDSPCLKLGRYPPRRCRGQDRNAFHQNILYISVCEYKHSDVRVPFLILAARMLDPKIWLFHRFASGTLGPVTFGLGLRNSCLVILFFNLLCSVPPAYL